MAEFSKLSKSKSIMPQLLFKHRTIGIFVHSITLEQKGKVTHQ